MALALCLPKRGGSAKILLLTKTSHQGSLVNLLTAAAESIAEAMGSAVRRLYTQVPVADTEVINAFLTFGYRPEGVIELPFNPNTDTLVNTSP